MKIGFETQRSTLSFQDLYRITVQFDVARDESRSLYFAVTGDTPADAFANGLRELARRIDEEYELYERQRIEFNVSGWDHE